MFEIAFQLVQTFGPPQSGNIGARNSCGQPRLVHAARKKTRARPQKPVKQSRHCKFGAVSSPARVSPGECARGGPLYTLYPNPPRCRGASSPRAARIIGHRVSLRIFAPLFSGPGGMVNTLLRGADAAFFLLPPFFFPPASSSSPVSSS